MTASTHPRITGFRAALEDALGPGEQAHDILQEVLGDLDEHLARSRAEGASEDEAVERALQEVGNPYELAHRVRREIPPFGGRVVTTIRYVVASGLMVWLLILMWILRAWSYGLSGFLALALVMLLHLPLILLLWPRIVWRRNWLFGLIPAGLALAIALVLGAGGTRSSSEITVPLPPTGEEVAPPPRESAPTFPYAILGSAGLVSLVLLLAMQQNSQRRRVLLGITLALGAVEVPFQAEEFVFRQDVARLQRFLSDSRKETGAFPTEEEIMAEARSLRGKGPSVRVTDGHFSLFWSRPLSPGFALLYSSEHDRVTVQD